MTFHPNVLGRETQLILIMGQSSSTHRHSHDGYPAHPQHPSNLEVEAQHGSARRRRLVPRDRPLSTFDATASIESESPPSRPFATFSRQISSQSVPIVSGRPGANHDVSTRDDVFYERHERRPMTTIGDMNIRNTPITHITASPMPRRTRLSRFGSIFTERPSTDGSVPGNFQFGRSVSIRAGLDEDTGRRGRRTSMFSSLNAGDLTLRLRRRREPIPISPPIPLITHRDSPRAVFESNSLHTGLAHSDNSTHPDTRASGFPANPLAARLSRVRHSITGQTDFRSPSTRSSEVLDAYAPPSQPLRVDTSNDSEFQLPPMSLVDTNTSLNEAVLDAANREPRPFEIPTVPEASEPMGLPAENHHWYEGLNSTVHSGRREGRRVTNILRRGSNRLTRRDVDSPWLHMLNAAASAVAAQISGNPEQSMTNVEALGSETHDGRLHRLSRVLQQAVHAHVNGQASERIEGGTALNSLRIFRFVSQSANSRSSHESNTARTGPPETASHLSATARDSFDDHEGRSVTIVLVAVRSAPSGQPTTEPREQEVLLRDPAIDSVISLPTLGQPVNLVRSNTGGFSRRTSRHSRLPNLRRASLGGAFGSPGTFPSNYDSQRHHRRFSSSRPSSGDATPNPGTATPLVLSDSPPGPAPPPSTPAEHTISAVSSQATTPNRRMSIVSSLQQQPLFDRETPPQASNQGDADVLEDHPFDLVQQRRRSDSESARYRDLGSGAARRNGVVEPDHLDPGEASPSGSRTWIFYVVGTNLPEDHPAWTTPSLFTDVSI